MIDRQNLQLADFLNRQVEGQNVPGLDGLISQAEGHLDRLNERLEGRLRELEMERHCTIADITHLGRAWVLPHPERATPALAPMVRDEEIERIAVEVATRHEEARGCQVESVEADNRGFDLISRRPHPEDPKTFIEVRFIEVKGRAGVGEIALTANEYKTAGRLKADYWLYAVFNCGGIAATARDPGPGPAGLDSRGPGRALSHRAGENPRRRSLRGQPGDEARLVLVVAVTEHAEAQEARLRRPDLNDVRRPSTHPNGNPRTRCTPRPPTPNV